MTEKQRDELLKLLQKFDEMFNEILGTCKIDAVDVKLKEDMKPI